MINKKISIIISLIVLFFSLSVFFYYFSKTGNQIAEYNLDNSLGNTITPAERYDTDKLRDSFTSKCNINNKKIVFGPYSYKEQFYYVVDNKVYDSDCIGVSIKKIKGLHNFYLYTKINSLFYSPHDDDTQIDFSKINQYNDRFYFARIFNHKLIPAEYYDNLKQNIITTNHFFSSPSFVNANLLLNQYERTQYAYLTGLKDLILAFKEDGQSKNLNIERKSFITHGEIDGAVTDLSAVITYQDLLKLLDRFNNNILNIEKNIEYRKKILSGEVVPDYKVTISPATAKERPGYLDNKTAREAFNLAVEFYKSSSTNVLDKKCWVQNPDEMKLIELNSICLYPKMDKALFYGVDKDTYPNILLAEYFLVEPKEHREPSIVYIIHFINKRNCPFIEETRLKWYLINDMIEEIGSYKISEHIGGFTAPSLEEQRVSILSSENNFLNYPSEDNLYYLSSLYKKLYVDLMLEGINSSENDNIWRRFSKIDSKIYLFNKAMTSALEAYETIDYYPPETSQIEGNYLKQIFINSLFYLSFMQWSDTVWQSQPIQAEEVLSPLDNDTSDFVVEEWMPWEQFKEFYTINKENFQNPESAPCGP